VASTGLHGANRLASNSLLEALVYARWIAEDVLATTTTAGKPGSAPSRQTQKQLQQDLRPQLRSLMDRDVGVFRDRAGLMWAKAWLATALGSGLLHAGTLDHDALAAAALIADSALRREESRGAHQRIDRPQTSPQRQHTIIEGLRGGTDPASVSVPPDHA
jgi:aspartate oxidase